MDALAFVGIGAGLVPFGLLILLIVALTGGRNEPDPDAERPAAIYYAGVMFVALFTVLFSVFTVVASLLNLTTDENEFRGFSESRSGTSFSVGGEQIESTPIPSFRQLETSGDNEEDDEDLATALRGLTIALAAAGLYLFHDRRRKDCPGGSVAERVRKTYLYSVSFVSVLVALAAAVVTLYAVVKMIAPGVTDAGTRGQAAVELAQSAFLALAAGALFLLHLRHAEPPAASIGFAPITPPEPPAPPPPAAPTRKRARPLKSE